MKIIISLVLALFIMNNICSQEKNSIIEVGDTIKPLKGSYYFLHSFPENFSPQFEVTSRANVGIKKEDKITVLFENNDTIYYYYWHFNKDTTNRRIYNENKSFSMPKRQFNELTKPLYSRYKGASVGAYSIPFRLRGIGGDNFDFESSLSLQANLVFGLGTRKVQTSWFDTSFGIGLTGVNLNSKNSVVTEDRTASALTTSFGFVFKPTRIANIGIFMGWDFLGQKDKEVEWKHNGKTWLGIGINISFNELKTEKSATESKK